MNTRPFSRIVNFESEARAVPRNPFHVHQVDLGHALLEHRDAGFDESLTLLGGVVLGVLAEIAQLASALDFLWQILRQLFVERGDLDFEPLDQRSFHVRF